MSKLNKRTFFHVSFDPKLGKLIHPMEPAGFDDDKPGKYEEPKIPRICVSTSIVGCIQAIFPNISHFFESLEVPHLDFHVYTITGDFGEDIVSPYLLSKLGMVHDAHVTNEHWLLREARFRDAGYGIRLANTNKLETILYQPFNNNKISAIPLGPDMFKAKLTKI